MKINWTTIRYIYGHLLILLSLVLAMATGVAVYYRFRCGEDDWQGFLVATLVTLALGVMSVMSSHHHRRSLSVREGFLVVAMAWVLFSLLGMIPYLVSGTFGSITDAFMETMAGFTTTGCTTLTDIDSLPHGILFWRCVTQWLGGLGIIVFSMSLLPMLGIGGTQMYGAETSGLGVDKLRPTIAATARRLWGIYIFFTALCALCYWLCGMGGFDAVCHALSTLASGGFSTHQASIGYFHSPLIEYVCIIFMFITGINYGLFYSAVVGKWKHFWKDEEFRVYCLVIVGATALFMLLEYLTRDGYFMAQEAGETVALADGSFAATLRTMLFHAASMVSSTGFQAESFDYQAWGPVFWIPTLLLMVMGGCASSTSGGLKVVRFVLMFKNARNEFIQQLEPRSYTSVRLNGRTVMSEVVYQVMALVLTYVMLLVVSIFFLQLIGLSFDTAIGTSISAFGNTGPALGSTGPASTWAGIPDIGKWYLCLCMLIGRLEIFTVVLLFTPMFWKR